MNESTIKTALVTGGGGYIGGAICEKLAADGATVVVADMNLNVAEKNVDLIIKSGGRAIAVQLDVCNLQSIHDVIAGMLRQFGQIDILVNCAGGSARSEISPLHLASDETVHRVIDMNLKGAIFCIKSVIPDMIERQSGKIVNIGSIAGVQGSKNLTDYSAAKAGIIAATKSLAMELGQYNINVNCVSPGLVPRPDENPQRAINASFLNRACLSKDVANLVSFLASDEASYITGQNYIIDGGRSLGLNQG